MTLLAQLASQNKLDEPNYVSKCLPVIVQLWSMNDRAIRTTLLKTLKSLIAITPASAVNKSIFEPMLAGFADSNAKMREDTLKNLAHVVDKLDEKNLQDKLIRCVSNLQNDAESSIRTNATIFLGRTASLLKEAVRTRIVCPAFAKAMRDPFVHCRLAGLKAAATCIELLDLQQLTCKIMPQACMLLLDRSADVRELSLKLLDVSAVQLRQYHEKTTQSDKAAAAAAQSANVTAGDQAAGGGGASSGGGSSWTSWVSDGLSKTIEKVAISGSDGDSSQKARSASLTTGSSDSSFGPRSNSSGSTASASAAAGAGGGQSAVSRATSSSNVSVDQDSSFVGNLPAGADDGWGDDNWGVDDDEGGRASEENGWGADDDLDLGVDEEDQAVGGNNGKVGALGGVGTLSASSKSAASASASGAGKLMVPAAVDSSSLGGLSAKSGAKPVKAAKPIVKKLDAADVSWDDF